MENVKLFFAKLGLDETINFFFTVELIIKLASISAAETIASCLTSLLVVKSW